MFRKSRDTSFGARGEWILAGLRDGDVRGVYIDIPSGVGGSSTIVTRETRS